MRVLIGASVIGVDVVYDTDTRAVSRETSGEIDWYLDGTKSTRITQSLDDIAACSGMQLSLKPPERFVRAYSSLGIDPPWADALPKAVFKGFVRNVTDQVTRACALDRRYYDETFVPINVFLASLSPAAIDPYRFKSLSGCGSVMSFRPDRTGYAQEVVYDRFGTRTGRLTVRSGPQILTVAKEHRDVLVSRYDGGQLVLLDFVSFEAQVALALAGRSPVADVYASANDEMFSGKGDREIIKRAVLGHLYGMGTKALQHTLETTLDQTSEIVKSLRRFFTGPITLDEALIRAQPDAKTIVNPFGRHVRLPDGGQRLALNTLVQSTAADAALLGFAAAGRYIIDQRIEALPIFVIHDGLLLDCAPSALEQLDDLVGVTSRSTGLTGEFPVRIKQLCS